RLGCGPGPRTELRAHDRGGQRALRGEAGRPRSPGGGDFLAGWDRAPGVLDAGATGCTARSRSGAPARVREIRGRSTLFPSMTSQASDPLLETLVNDFGGNYVFALDVLEQYRSDRHSVDASWREYCDK